MKKDQWQTNQSLLIRLKDQQDEKSWDHFVKYYQPFIYVILRRMGMNHHDTEEISQKTILKIWQKLPAYYDSSVYGKFRNWIGRITHNAAVDFFKASKRYDKKLNNLKENTFKAHTDSEVDSMAEKEWQGYLTSMAWKNIEGKVSDNAMKMFSKLTDGELAESIAQEFDVSVNTVYVYKKRVKEQMIKEINLLKDLLE